MKSIWPLAIGAAFVFVAFSAARKPIPAPIKARMEDALKAADDPAALTNPIANVTARSKLEASARELEAAGFTDEAEKLRKRRDDLAARAPQTLPNPGPIPPNLPNIPNVPNVPNVPPVDPGTLPGLQFPFPL